MLIWKRFPINSNVYTISNISCADFKKATINHLFNGRQTYNSKEENCFYFDNTETFWLPIRHTRLDVLTWLTDCRFDITRKYAKLARLSEIGYTFYTYIPASVGFDMKRKITFHQNISNLMIISWLEWQRKSKI